jgi:hypothetical protein
VAFLGTKFANCSCSDDQSPSCQCLRLHFYRKVQHIYDAAFFYGPLQYNVNLAVHGSLWVLAAHGNKVHALPQSKDNLIFYFGILQKCAQFSVGDLDPDEFGSWSFLVRFSSLKEVCQCQPQSQVRIWGVTKSTGSEPWFHIYGYHTPSFKTADCLTEKRVCKPLFKPIR